MRLRVSVALLLLIAADACTSEHTFPVRGRVVGFGDDDRTLIVEHEEVSGLMPAMTMPFTAADSVSTSGLRHGDAIAFRLSIDADQSRIHSIRVLPDTAMSAHPAGTSTHADGGSRSILDVGMLAPQTELMTHADSTLHLRELEGRFVVLTFMYTRCPLPDFCPLMMRNFAALQPKLSERYGARAHLVSVSLDPEYDTPAVLRDYAKRYTDRLDTWTFATGDSSTIRAFAEQFGAFTAPGEGDIVHNLVTVLIGPGGIIQRYWRGNEWTPADVIAAIDRATGAPQS